MDKPPRNSPPTDVPPTDVPPTDVPPTEPEPTTVTVKASLGLAGLFDRDQTRTVERTPFIEALIANGKLTVIPD